MGWWIFFGILLLILLLPLGVSVLYDALGVRVRVLAGPIRLTVFPMKKKEPKQPKEAPEQEQPEPKQKLESKDKTEEKSEKPPLPEAPKPPKQPEETPGGSVTDFLPLVELALKFVGEFFHKTLHIDVLYLKLTMAGDDPADLAINYGRTWAALGNLWPYVNRMFTIKKRDIQVQCDFETSEMLVNARVDITVSLARLLGLILNYGCRMAWKFFQIRSQQNKAAKAAKNDQKNANE